VGIWDLIFHNFLFCGLNLCGLQIRRKYMVPCASVSVIPPNQNSKAISHPYGDGQQTKFMAQEDVQLGELQVHMPSPQETKPTP
jgi:hypothetical protein